MRKNFILDTNVLLHNADSIESFADNVVILPMAVIEELDKFKSKSDELGRNARHVIRRIDELREKGRLGEGVPIAKGGLLKIVAKVDVADDTGLEEDAPDNRILKVAFMLHKKGERVIFVSKDINARLKADALGIEVQDFEKQKVNFDELYAGYRQVKVNRAVIDDFFKNKNGDFKLPGHDFFPNEFVILANEENEKHTALARSADKDTLAHLQMRNEKVWTIKSRSLEQRMALELLMDSGVEIVTLVGQAGTGKTLLALAAGLESTLRSQKYDKILVTRPIIPLGKDIGYLPGGKDEKLSHWMQPIFDNLSYLLRTKAEPGEDVGSIKSEIDRLKKENIVEMEALTYIRGRSIPRQFVIVDEAQNLTPHEVKTIVSRAGEGTKMVLTGDPYQIDSPYLDASSNGLTYAAERLKTLPIHGHVTLRKSERSKLAAIAADML